jgi:uncharacterized protein YdgA (DUF945 family)
MKKLVAVVVALILVLAAAPWFMGRMAHSRIDRGLDSLVKEIPYIKIAERKWTSGWFRSESLVTFQVVLPGMGANKPVNALADAAPIPVEPAPQVIPKFQITEPLRFSVRSQVLHGPVLGSAGLGLARMDTKFVISEEIRNKIIEMVGTDEPVRIRTRLAFFGGGTTTISGDARTVTLDKLGVAQAKGSVAWEDFKLSIGTGREGKSYDFKGAQPRIEFKSDNGAEHVLISDMSMVGSGARVLEDLYEGEMTFGIGKVSITSSQSPTIAVSDIKYGVDADSQGDYFDYAIRIGSGEIKTAALDAVKVQIKGVHYDMTLRHLHSKTLQKLTTAVRDAYSTAMENPENAEAAMVGPLTEHGMELLKHDPELLLDRIGIVTDQGEAAFKGVIKLSGVTDEDLKSGGLALVPKLMADITFEAPQAMLEKVPNGAMVIGMGIDQGYLKREGGKVTSHIQFRNGKLTINDKSPQLPPQFGGQAPAPAPEPPID